MHESTMDISLGRSYKSKKWANKRWSWIYIRDKLLKPHRTRETKVEYSQASKDERQQIKDVGGYVGGFLRGGRRKPDNVMHRQILTLDLDYATLDVWHEFKELFTNEAILHSTHSHSAKTPRYRLIMPLNREVAPDEYVALARRVAGDINIEYFDNTTFQASRLMFWPSCSKDVEFYVKHQKGEFLNVDDVLNTYLDWKDSSSWPTSEKFMKTVDFNRHKQQDPRKKLGIVGAFCRTYGVSEVLDGLLKDKYNRLDKDRYTYINGSTAGGLIVYDDLFCFSFHGTDPISGRLCNAWDLARIHLFGTMDLLRKDGKEAKSYKELEKLVLRDAKVKKTIAKDIISRAQYDFDVVEPEVPDEPDEPDEWLSRLVIDTKGRYLSSATNLNLIFTNDPHLKEVFKYNQFDNKRYIYRDVPWRKVAKPEPIKNVDYAGIRNYIESIYGIVSSSKIDDSLALIFQKHAFHPVKKYLDNIRWDGVERIDMLLVDYFGCSNNEYTRQSIVKTLVGAVARIYKPGSKFDLVLTLVGKQGTGKSTLAKKLGKDWFSDSFNTVNGKDSFEQLQGAWIIEMAELAGLRKAEIESVKHFISKQEDTFRPAYARATETFPRQCVFIGTTNNKDFLTDPTGNRRFMPIDINMREASKDIFGLDEKTVDQMWAEAVARYKRGEKLYLNEAGNKIARIEQSSHSGYDERKGVIGQFLDIKLPRNWDSLGLYERRIYFDDEDRKGDIQRDIVCVAEIWCECLCKEKNEMTRYKTRSVNDVMKSMEGWTLINSVKKFSLYGTQRYFVRI